MAIKIKVVNPDSSKPFPYGKMSSANKDFLLRNVGCVLDVDLKLSDGYVLDSGFVVHNNNAYEINTKQPSLFKVAERYRQYASVIEKFQGEEYPNTLDGVRYNGIPLSDQISHSMEVLTFNGPEEYTFMEGRIEGVPVFEGDRAYHEGKQAVICAGGNRVGGALCYSYNGDTQKYVAGPENFSFNPPMEEEVKSSGVAASFPKPMVGLPFKRHCIIVGGDVFSWDSREDMEETLDVLKLVLKGGK